MSGRLAACLAGIRKQYKEYDKKQHVGEAEKDGQGAKKYLRRAVGRRRRKGGRIQKAKGTNTEEKEKEKEERMSVRRSRPRSGCSPQGPAERPRKVQSPSPSAAGAPGRGAGLSEVGGAGKKGRDFFKLLFCVLKF